MRLRHIPEVQDRNIHCVVGLVPISRPWSVWLRPTHLIAPRGQRNAHTSANAKRGSRANSEERSP
jgi:hypothetical protein